MNLVESRFYRCSACGDEFIGGIGSRCKCGGAVILVKSMLAYSEGCIVVWDHRLEVNRVKLAYRHRVPTLESMKEKIVELKEEIRKAKDSGRRVMLEGELEVLVRKYVRKMERDRD